MDLSSAELPQAARLHGFRCRERGGEGGQERVECEDEETGWASNKRRGMSNLVSNIPAGIVGDTCSCNGQCVMHV